MKKIALPLCLIALATGQVLSQARITQKELDGNNKNLKSAPLLLENDADFSTTSAAQWANESAVILSQKTSFDFDKKGVGVGKRIGRNIWGLVLAPVSLGTSIYLANANNETNILIEETERRRILLRDRFAIDQYSILYFRLNDAQDAFSARVIKKDGSKQAIKLDDAVRVEDLGAVPSIYKSYTDYPFTSRYRPVYYKMAVPDLEEGDILEYEFRNLNSQSYFHNPSYKEFTPIYYLCNRELPVARQVIQVAAQDDRYYIGYKSQKGAPEFATTMDNGTKVYRWVDENREKMNDTRYVSEFMELPSVKFQMIYARSSGREFVWYKDENDMKRQLSLTELGDKARIFWFNPEKLNKTGNYSAGLRSSMEATADEMFGLLKKKGVTGSSDEDFARKAYYYIRSQTLYNNWSDFAFARVFSNLLKKQRIDHEIVITAPNTRTDIANIAFTQEIAWLVKIKNRYYANPMEHLNPEDLPVSLVGNTAISFNYKNEKSTITNEVLPVTDTFFNAELVQVVASLDAANMVVDKTVEMKGLLKADLQDDVLALTPFMEGDYRNYDGASMWEGMDARTEEKATNNFSEQKKKWKEEKPEMMKPLVESEYGATVETYKNFRLQQDGRTYKKPNLKYSESFVLADMTSSAGNDLLVPLPSLIGRQASVRKEEERTRRTLPIDLGYPRTMSWRIEFTIPAGYTVKGLESLTNVVDNECGSFNSKATLNGDKVLLEVRKMYKGRRFDVAKWPQLLTMIDAAYNFSQAKLVLVKL
ncbi:MAG: hypothetical protein P0Y53_19350 [Candidatus Pseudobacter hemicellulosilyticus]|uniref:DUF3857 domain-containing protein n=1 Tax=Candidatus Pseudobacter hemicellulosilyticus TaxID=3121375 RepID=A0AAJ5WS21_9BACT|nr:MAG: hypothetical protein P0Y53_19350 [Pseudobacter sp.]